MAHTESVTVLFTDLVGYTELISALPPAAADDLRRTHFAALRDALRTTGGTEIKNLGDGLMVRFSSAGAAVSGAEAMQQAVERHNRRSRTGLSVRIGISSGDVIVEDGDLFGEPIVEASRLCNAAQPGQILVADVIRVLARRSGYVFSNERELQLKGLVEPVVAWDVQWARLSDGDGPEARLSPGLPKPPTLGLIGRHGEGRALDEALRNATSRRRRQVVLLEGEAGVGKSALAASFARRANALGATVLYGRCDEDLRVPYKPFGEALSHYLSGAEEGVLAALGPERLSVLGRLVPQLPRAPSHRAAPEFADKDAERWFLLNAVRAVLAGAMETAPLVFVIEDLHWAGDATLQLLTHVISQADGPLVIVATYREVGLSSSHPVLTMLAALAGQPGVARLPLRGLSGPDVVSLVEAATGHSLEPSGLELSRALFAETAGNPFFLTEMLRHLIETRALVQRGSGRWVPALDLAAAGLPDTVRHVVGARVARLGRDATKVLSVAAAVGNEFDVTLLASAADRTEEQVLDVLDEARSAALVSEIPDGTGRFRFSHALVQHTLYEDVSAARRARIHRRLAETLEQMTGGRPGVRAGELARHFLAAVPLIGPDKAVTYARLAGETALESLAPVEALKWFRQALDLLPGRADPAVRAGCLAGLGEAELQAGSPTYRETLLESAKLAALAGDAPTAVRAALVNNRGFQSTAGQIDTERVAAVERGLRLVGADEPGTRCRLLALLATELTWNGDYPARRTLFDEAMSIADGLGDPAARLDVRLHWGSIWMPETVDDLRRMAETSVALAGELGDPVRMFWAWYALAAPAIQQADIGRVREAHSRMSGLASEVGQPLLKWTVTSQLSWSALLAGDLERADELAYEALRLGTETGQPDAMAYYGGQLFQIRQHQGRTAEILDLVVEQARANPGISTYRAVAASALVDAGRHEEAGELLRADVESRFAAPADFLVPSQLCTWASVAADVGNAEAAEMLHDRLSPWSDLVAFTGCTVHECVPHALALLANVVERFDEAEDRFEQSLRIYRRMQAPYFVGRAELGYGRMLLRRGGPTDATRAERLLRSAADTSARYGYGLVNAQVAGALG